MEDKINDIISGLEIGLGLDGASWSSIESAVKILKYVRDLGPDLVGLSEDDFHGALLKVIG